MYNIMNSIIIDIYIDCGRQYRKFVLAESKPDVFCIVTNSAID